MAAATPAAAPLDGREVRRLTRRSAAARASTTWWTRVEDAWSTIAYVAILLAVAGGWLASVRDEISVREPVAAAPLPASAAALVALVVVVAGLIGLLDRLGPISASPAAAGWWLPLPADRRGLLRGDLVRLAAGCAATSAVLALPLAMVLPGATPATVTAAAVTAAAAAAGLVGAVALAQTRGRTGRLSTVAGAVAVLASTTAALLAIAPPLARAAGELPAVGGAVPLAAALAAAAVAVLLLVAADRGLGRIGAGALRTLGSTSAFASASVFSMDLRDLGRALARPPRRAPSRPRRFRPARGPGRAVVLADLTLMARSPWQLGQLLVAVALPVLAVRTEGLDRLPVAGAVGLVLGWLLAAVAVGHPSRQGHAMPALDRLLPLSPGRLVVARAVVPAVLLTVVCGCGGLLIGQSGDDLFAWTVLALGAVPAWTAAAVRGAYRPELDWGGPVVSTPMGIVPAGAGATLVQGVDVGLLGSAPILVALLVDGPPLAVLVAVQWGWATAVATAALTYLAHRGAAKG
ncbi:DUF6297 family protein [Blastococcus xanthinilyticus]|uniref:DUF6297 family protein n=1 Tax=Blastococcus xanthinilyticus TaxID=1564164 RepID=UPI0014128AD5|nr:DUF6297 family protein [Blastococcus xanthinilyticus]